MIVVALALRHSLDLLTLRPSEPGHAASDVAVTILYDQIRAIILGTAGLLLALATINAFIVATFAARDAARNHAVLRAVGATPRQTVATLIISQLGACYARGFNGRHVPPGQPWRANQIDPPHPHRRRTARKAGSRCT
jgi:hypothetical protein